MNSYELLEQMVSKRERPRGVATSLRLASDSIVVRYHDTDVLRAYKDGKVELNSGGWQTVTTKARINQYLTGPRRLYQKDYQWYVATPTGDIPFEDGMVLD